MKKIHEQVTNTKKVNVIDVPALQDEIKKLQQIPEVIKKIQKEDAKLEVLCEYNDGTPMSVRPIGINGALFGKRYSVGVKTQKGNYIVYDGRVLSPVEGKTCGEEGSYKLMINSKGEILKGAASSDALEQQYVDDLKKFGIDPTNAEEDFYGKITYNTKKIQELIDNGARSKVFKLWNKILNFYSPNTDNLRPREGQSDFEIPQDTLVLTKNYRQLPGGSGRWGFTYDGKDAPIYVPKSYGIDFVETKLIRHSPNKCRTALANYLANALQKQSALNSGTPLEVSPSAPEERIFLKECALGNSFDNFEGFTDEIIKSTDEITGETGYAIGKKLRPFGFFNRKLNFKEVSNILRGNTKYITSSNPYRIDLRSSTNESLKNTIKENLIKVKQKKKTNLQLENKIIKNRLNIISESNTKKTKKQIEKFNNNLISEIIYFNKQGFDKKLISENVWDMLKGFFGTGVDAGVETFKEYLASFLVDTLTPFDSDSWIGGTIVKALGNVPISDYFNGKVLECDYLTKVLAKSILEEGLDKMIENVGFDGAMVDIFRNAFVDVAEDTSVGQKLEKGLAEMVCPKLKGVKNNMDKLGDSLKEKAFSD